MRIKGSIGCRENKNGDKRIKKILIWSLKKKKAEGFSLPPATPSPPARPTVGEATSYECETFLSHLGSSEGGKCNGHKSKADVLKKQLINLSSTDLQFVGFPKGPKRRTPGGRAEYLGAAGILGNTPPHVLNKEKHFASSQTGTCNKHTIVTICGFVWVGWGSPPHTHLLLMFFFLLAPPLF